MGGSHTKMDVKDRDGKEMSLSHTASDAPILPIAQLERLQNIAPNRVDWVFDETSLEATFRRSETSRVNTFIFIERLLGQIFGLVIGLSGLALATYMAVHGAQTAACVVGGGTVVGLVSAFLLRNRSGGAGKSEPGGKKNGK